MSILDRLKKQESPEGKKMFCVVAGARLAGKTTLAGTLPGRTLMLQAMVRESGSDSARAKAKVAGNHLDVLNFASVEELLSILKEAKADTDFDNIYVDSLGAITELKCDEPKLQALMKSDNWSAFREVGDSATAVILALKELTYAEKTKKAKNTFLTVALEIKLDKNGTIVDVALQAKGNVAVTSVTKFGEAVVTLLPPTRTEAGETEHKLITKTTDWWPGRIDGILREQNPGVLPADLSKVLELRNKQ